MIEVVEYDESWPGMFADLRTRWEHVLAGAPVVAIEHVGSTSVPGLASKPVIDVNIASREPVREQSASEFTGTVRPRR